MRSDRDRLRDILQALAKIETQVPRGEDVFCRDEMLQVWMVHHLEIIGEAARALSPAFRARYPQVQWAKLIAMRNILVHEYFGLNLRQVWVVATRDLPVLKCHIQQIVQTPGGETEEK